MFVFVVVYWLCMNVMCVSSQSSSSSVVAPSRPAARRPLPRWLARGRRSSKDVMLSRCEAVACLLAIHLHAAKEKRCRCGTTGGRDWTWARTRAAQPGNGGELGRPDRAHSGIHHIHITYHISFICYPPNPLPIDNMSSVPWIPDTSVKECMICKEAFNSLTRRKQYENPQYRMTSQFHFDISHGEK